MKIVIGNNEQADLLIYPVFMEELVAPHGVSLRSSMKTRGTVTWFYGRNGEQDIVMIGLGDRAKFSLEAWRDAAGNVGRGVGRSDATVASVSLACLQDIISDSLCIEDLLTAWVEGWLLGTYVFDKYTSKGKVAGLQLMQLEWERNETGYEREIEVGRVRAAGTALARNLCNEAPNDLHPESFVNRILDIFKDREVSIHVYRGEELKERQMNGLLAVGGGSVHAPALVEITYNTDPEAPLLALVGKGMTFDMGGMNVKTSRDISDARFDMGGAAAVIGAMDILTTLQVKTRVTALIAIAENVPDGAAYLPSHVVQYPNGLSVQVANTDAEGRLILADALLHAAQLGADEVIDIATLTGSIGHALGLRMAGVWGDDHLTESLVHTGKYNGDPIWRLPLIDEDVPLLHSSYADLVNIASIPYGGANMAALFLRHFVAPQMKWCHIDMANTVQVSADQGYKVLGATGYGVRLLADFVCARPIERKGGLK